MKSFFKTIFFIGILIGLNSCATILLGTKQKVTLNSSPQGAEIYVNGNKINKRTPCEIKIKRKNKPTQFNDKNEVVYTFKKDNYKDVEYRDKSKVHWIVFLNIIPSYGLTSVVDILLKSHRKYKKEIGITLPPYNTDKTPPTIVMISPDVKRGFKTVLQSTQVTITGKVTDINGVSEVLINGKHVGIDTHGYFSKTVLLSIGDNSFTVKATDTNKNEIMKTFIVERRSGQNVIVDNSSNNYDIMQTGKYYALIIGNNNYQDDAINNLDEPINDATKLYDVLTTKYTFEKDNVIFLKNATYVEMIEAFDKLGDVLTNNDNLIVFYAGHGWWDENKNLGYWLPIDAKKNSTAFWIANSRISDYMKSINSMHTLLIADACFSGSIFKTRKAFSDAQPAINKLYELPSKSAMTSGNLKEVPDKSVFLQYLVKRLSMNSQKYISADQLFASFRIAVMNNSTTEPQFGTIQNAGDEGGEFIFIKRDK